MKYQLNMPFGVGGRDLIRMSLFHLDLFFQVVNVTLSYSYLLSCLDSLLKKLLYCFVILFHTVMKTLNVSFLTPDLRLQLVIKELVLLCLHGSFKYRLRNRLA